MQILFVCSGNSNNGISPIIIYQAKSRETADIEISFFPIKGKGLLGYLKNIKLLKSQIKQNKFDIIHAHYSLSAFAASFAGAKPLVVSLMGSDVKEKKWYKIVIKFFNKFFWGICIVKSEDMKSSSGLIDAHVIPNGVDYKKFRVINRNAAIKKLGWIKNKKHILFAANPKRPEKNFILAKQAIKLLNNKIELHYLNNVDNNIMPFYYNASDIVLLTSFWEGSPNVIKEAMACNCPIVSTVVGDVKNVIGDTKGCYLCTYKPDDIVEKIKLAFDFGKRTNGRNNIKHLNEKIVAEKIISLYKEILNG